MQVNSHHVVDKGGLPVKSFITDPTGEVAVGVEMDTVHVGLTLPLAVEVSVAEPALREVSHVYGGLPVSLHMEVQVLHELQAV